MVHQFFSTEISYEFTSLAIKDVPTTLPLPLFLPGLCKSERSEFGVHFFCIRGKAWRNFCRGSGFTFGSHNMHWVRQKPGKALVWMGRVWNNGQGQDYAKSFEGRIEITRDNSKNMVYLKLSGLTEEDSAVYFCARQAQ
ncbi:hypothetical protein cypCar_00031859 [Cyprinus carpio]|nr:hypothetical protein cypCar_00031859 [Cyprinus carpio]